MVGETRPDDKPEAALEQEEYEFEDFEAFGSILPTLQRLGGLSLAHPSYEEDHSDEAEPHSPEQTLKFRRRGLLLQRFEAAYTNLDSTILRAHQIDGVDGVYDFIMLPNPSDQDDGLTKRGVLTHAPGAGKSILAAAISSMFGVGEQLAEDLSPVRVLYFTHDRKGLGQTMGKDEVLRGFAKVSPDLKTIMVEKGRSFRGISVVGMTYAALRHWYKRRPDVFDDFDITFEDECQEAMGPKTLQALNYVMRGKINIALTGSPELSDERSVYELWPERIHNISFREGVEERGILNSFVLYRFRTGEVLKSAARGSEYTTDAYRHLAKNEFLNQHACKLALLLAGHNIKATIFAFRGGGSKHAVELAEQINGSVVFDRATQLPRPARAKAIGTFQTQTKNDTAFAEFDRGELDIITTTQMGETAWDPKNLNAIILICPTRSLRAIIQRLGRGARISDQPTVVIHYDYDDDKQKSPYDVFGEPEAQGALIAPKDSETRKYITGGAKEYRHDDTPEPVQDLYESLSDMLAYAEVHSWHRSMLRRGGKDIREQGFTSLAPIAEEYEMDQLILAGLLRRNRIKVISLDENDERVIYAPATTIRAFVEQEIAEANTYTAAQLMEKLGMSRRWVYRRIANDPTESRFPRDSLDVRRQQHYAHSVYERLLKESEEAAQEMQDSEMSIVELCKKHGVDSSRATEWFARRSIAPARRKRADKSRDYDLICYPKKYEAQFAWHWSAPQLPKDHHFVILTKVFDRSLALRKMGHAQREELLTQLAIEPQRFRTKTSFNYYISRDEQLALNRAATNTIIREDPDYLLPGISAALIGQRRDKELFMQHMAANDMPLPEDILTPSYEAMLRSASGPKGGPKTPQAPEPAIRNTTPPTRQNVEARGAKATLPNQKPPDTTVAQAPVHIDGLGDIKVWDDTEKLQTTIAVARELGGYKLTGALVAAKAREYGLAVHERVRNGQVFHCMDPDDIAVFTVRYRQDAGITSAAAVASLLQVPQAFVQDMATDTTAALHNRDEEDETDASLLKKNIQKASSIEGQEWQVIHKEIVLALRSLGIARPPQGKILDDRTLERVRARIVLRAEPLLHDMVINAVRQTALQHSAEPENKTQ